jgi:hypothetical protein
MLRQFDKTVKLAAVGCLSDPGGERTDAPSIRSSLRMAGKSDSLAECTPIEVPQGNDCAKEHSRPVTNYRGGNASKNSSKRHAIRRQRRAFNRQEMPRPPPCRLVPTLNVATIIAQHVATIACRLIANEHSPAR